MTSDGCGDAPASDGEPHAVVADERYLALIARAPVAIRMLDESGACMFVNQAWCDLTGLSVSDAAGAGWIAAIHPGDRARVSAAAGAGFAAGETLVLDYRICRGTDGRETSVRATRAVAGTPPRETVWAVVDITDLREAGVNLRMMNLGGGFPTRYRDDVPEIDQFGLAIMTAMTDHFGNNLPDMVIEPGRFIVGDAGVVSAEVVLVSRRDPDDPVRWVYLDIGRFGGLAETEGEAIKYRILTPHDGTPMGPVAIAGPTCDGADILYEKSNYRLPLALRSGDRVELLSTGAYVTPYASQRFNGFAPLAEHYL